MSNLFKLNDIKTYAIPKHINDIFDKHFALKYLAESLIGLPFFSKKAVKLMVKANKLEQDGWRLLNEAYPLLRTGNYTRVGSIGHYGLMENVVVKSDDLKKLKTLLESGVARLK